MARADRLPWDRLPEETKAAFDSFVLYYQMPARQRSVDAAWRASKRAAGEQVEIDKRAPNRWFHWSKTHRWVARALAHDEHLAEQDRLLWEERRRQLLEDDWNQGARLREVVEDSIPHARSFIRQSTAAGPNGETIITLSFDIDSLARVLAQASRLQRLATDEPTDSVQLHGAALDAYIAAQLERLAHGGETGDGETAWADEVAEDDGAAP